MPRQIILHYQKNIVQKITGVKHFGQYKLGLLYLVRMGRTPPNTRGCFDPCVISTQSPQKNVGIVRF